MTSLTLERLGWSDAFAEQMPADRPDLRPARVASVYAARVGVWVPGLEPAERLASLRSHLLGRDGPVGGIAVGDWVAVGETGDEVVVELALARRTSFLRQAAGERAEPQAIAANVDRVFVVTAVDADFNLRRLERYLVAIAAGGAEAQVLLTKADLVDDVKLAELIAESSELAPTFATSARSGHGVEMLRERVPAGTTATLVGSSGVGKSALVNCLLGRDAQLEGAVRSYDRKGRHTTTRRELFLIPHEGAGLLIDTPGMRELKPWIPDGEIIDDAFDDVIAIASQCRYRDCKHEREPGCAVLEAVKAGEIDDSRVVSWRKLMSQQGELSPRQATFAAVASKRHARSQEMSLRKRLREKG